MPDGHGQFPSGRIWRMPSLRILRIGGALRPESRMGLARSKGGPLQKSRQRTFTARSMSKIASAAFCNRASLPVRRTKVLLLLP